MNDFKHSFYGVEKIISDCSIDVDDFESLYPWFVFDVSKQMDRLVSSNVDISIKMEFTDAIPAQTDA